MLHVCVRVLSTACCFGFCAGLWQVVGCGHRGYRGASTVKWTTLDHYTYLSENDSKQYTNFEISGKKPTHVSKTY